MRRAIPKLLLALLGACAHTGADDAYLESAQAQVDEADRVDGKVLVQIDPDLDRYLITGGSGPLDRPTLFTVAVGVVARDEALKSFGALFRGGAAAKPVQTTLKGYRVVVEPRAWTNTSGYGEMRAEGLAPRMSMSLTVKVALLDAGGNRVWERSYDSGIMQGRSYFPRGVAGERLGAAANAAITRLVERSAIEAAAEARRLALASP